MSRALAPIGQQVPLLAKLETGTPSIEEQEIEAFKQQDLFLPIANVGRMMKDALPPTAKVGKDAKESMQECASEFISFLTSEAAEHSNGEKRKTLNGEDIIFALETLGFSNYATVMRTYLARYRLSIKGESEGKGKKTARQSTVEDEEEEEYEEEEAQY